MSRESFENCISIVFREAVSDLDQEEVLPNFRDRFNWAVFDDEHPTPTKPDGVDSEKIEFLAVLSSWETEIDMSLQTLEDTELYVRRFPYGETDLSKTRHLRRHIEKYIEEMYILKERLVGMVDAIDDMYDEGDLEIQYELALPFAKKIAKNTLNPITGYGNVRGTHVHEKRYTPPEIKKLAQMEQMIRLMEDDDKTYGVIMAKRDEKYKKVRKEWAERVKREISEIKKMIDQYFGLLRNVLFDSDCNPRLAEET